MVGVDPIGVGQLIACLQLVLLHARLLNEVVGLFIGGAVQRIDHTLGDQRTQALQGTDRADAIGQREQAWEAAKDGVMKIFTDEMKKEIEKAAKRLADKAAKGSLTKQQRAGLMR